MPAFRYQHGDRPLDGFTIEHGVGRGGFGEVYYAVSDAGREVALKAVQNYEDIELRGIRQCMNLKSPHLVSIFDVKHNDRGEPFVIMEFVSGPSLNELQVDHPNGLGTAKAAFFLREIGKGLTYLHDCGVVHRDLKPHNVFYEDGFVKIGDYSLSKMISTSHMTGHTMTVGTVHYMAPEISKGRYGPSIDIYALGIMLYEMLTGQPPFVGESMGEVLLKHVMEDPDVSMLEEPFASTIKRALAKDPADRFQTAEEMVAAVFGEQHIENSVAAFNPQSLSVVAERVAEKASAEKAPGPAQEAGGEFGHGYAATEAITPPAFREPVEAYVDTSVDETTRTPIYRFGQLLGRIGSEAGVLATRAAEYRGPVSDPMTVKQRKTLGLLCILVFTVAIAMLAGGHGMEHALIPQFALIVVSVIAVRAVRKSFDGQVGEVFSSDRWYEREHWLWTRLAFFGTAMVAAFVLALVMERILHFGMPANSLAVVSALLPLAVMSCLALTSPARAKRIGLLPVIVAYVLATLPLHFSDYFSHWPRDISLFFSGAIAAAIVMTIQVLSPFDPRASAHHAPKHSWLDLLAGALGADTSKARAQQVSAEQPIVAELVQKPDEKPADPVSISPKSRAIASILAIVPLAFGIGGLHRFYTGRVASGILWLVTWGLFGIGQLYDIILILSGGFQDADGRLVLNWRPETHHSRPGERVNHLSKVPYSRARGGSSRSLGGLLVGLALLTGVLLAIRIPEAASVGLLEGMEIRPNDMRDLFSMDDWPKLVTRVGTMLAAVVGFLGVALFIFGRGPQGGLHMTRGLVGCLILGGVVPIMYAAFYSTDWQIVATSIASEEYGPATWEFVKRGDFLPIMLGACVVLVLGTFLLAWPAKKEKVLINSEAPVQQSDREVVHS